MSKKIALLALGLAMISAESMAQLSGNGFYRVQNVLTNRYMAVENNRVVVNTTSTSVTAASIRTKSLDKVISHPGSIIYFDNRGSNRYDLQAQGFDIQQGFGYLPYIVKSSANNDAYRCYGQQAGVQVFLSDFYDPDEEDQTEGYVRSNGRTTRDWYVKPINNTDNYFGVAPSLQSEGYYYQPLYTSFAFTPENENTQIFYISKVENGQAVLKEITGTVAGGTPVIVKSTSSNAADNILTPTTASGTTASDNQLKGVYFNYYYPEQSIPENRTAYNASTMRVLRVQSDGTLAFVVDSSLDYLPANESYLLVAAGSPDVIPVGDGNTTGISDITSNGQTDASKQSGIYTATGVKVRDNNDTNGLKSGLYIVNGKARIVK